MRELLSQGKNKGMKPESIKILLIDTNAEVLSYLKDTLVSEGYSVNVCTHSLDACKMAAEINPHLILTELNMPGLDGIEICTELRSHKAFDNTRIVFYSDISEDNSLVAAFNAGADGYIVKPIKPRVLISRIKAYLRRHYDSVPVSQKVTFRGLKIDRERYVIFKDENEIVLPRKEFELLSLLSSVPQKVFTRKEISKLIWGYDVVTNRTIDVHIRKLREKLGKDYIKTFKGIGYSLEV